VNLFASILAAVLVPLVLVVFSGTLWLAYRFGGRKSAVLALVFTGGILALAVLWLMQSGTSGRAQIAAKIERITEAQGEILPAVRHELILQVRPLSNMTGDGGDLSTLNVSSQSFDRVHEGDVVPVTFVHFGPFRLTRLTGDGLNIPWQRLSGLMTLCAKFMTAAGLVCVLGILFLKGRGRWIAGSVIVVAVVMDILALHPEWESRPDQGRGIITQVTHVTAVELQSDTGPAENFTLRRPYDEVEFILKPNATTDPVKVVDRIDAKSMNFAVGQSVEVAYSPSSPREARIIGGKRSHVISGLLSEEWRYVMDIGFFFTGL